MLIQLAAPPPATHHISLRNINKSFGKHRALKDVSLDLAWNRAHVVLGHNGAGKSTLLNVLTGVYEASGGAIELDGEQVPHLQTSRHLKLGICASHNVLFDNLTVYQHLKMFSLFYNIQNKRSKIDKIVK